MPTAGGFEAESHLSVSCMATAQQDHDFGIFPCAIKPGMSLSMMASKVRPTDRIGGLFMIIT